MNNKATLYYHKGCLQSLISSLISLELSFGTDRRSSVYRYLKQACDSLRKAEDALDNTIQLRKTFFDKLTAAWLEGDSYTAAKMIGCIVKKSHSIKDTMAVKKFLEKPLKNKK